MAFVIYLLFLSWCLLGCVCFHQRRIFFHKQTIDNKNNNNYNNNNVQRENKILFAGVQEIIEDDDANRMEAFEAARIVASANSLDDKRKTKIRQPKEPVKKLTVREKTGYQYADKDGEYDVPILNSSLWFRLQAVKTKEFVVGNSVISLGSEGRFKGRIEDVFVPIVCYPRFKGDVLVAVQKPITPGLVYVKARMDPEVADALESITFVVRLPKNQKTQLVSPLTPEQGADLERARQLMVTDLDPETQKIRKDEYVSVVSGLHLGKYGVVTGTKAGKLEVLLRGGFADEQATLEPEQVRYLADPPEKKIKEMTAKDAVEALMASNPKHPLLRALKKEGILNEILYTEEERQAMQASREKRFEDRKLRDEDYSSRAGGREGGARIRSIAVEPKRPLRQEVSDSSSAYSKDSTGWGSPAASSGKTLNNADSTDDWLSSYLDTNLDSFTATESGKGGSGSRQVDPEDADFDE